MSTTKGNAQNGRTGVLTRALVTGSVLAGLIAAFPAAGEAEQVAAAHDDVVRLTNAERQKAGCPPLTAAAELNRAAQAHADDMAAHNVMQHAGSDGSSMAVRAERAGYAGWRSLAENVAAGYPTANEVVAGWMSNSGHRANILNCQLKDVGVGYTVNPNTAYGAFWTQDFGTR